MLRSVDGKRLGIPAVQAIDEPVCLVEISAQLGSQARFEHSTIRDFVPLLVERRVREVLTTD